MAEQSNRVVDRRSAAEDPRPGDVVGYFLASNAPLKRTVVEVSGNPCPAFSDHQRARMVKVWYRNQHDQLRSCSLYSWRQWLNYPDPSAPWPPKRRAR